MKILYFAWVREKIGKAEEDIALPQHVKTIADLLSFLKAQGDHYAYALEKADLIRVAVNHQHQNHDALLDGATEIALFPPMTGG